MCLTRTRLVISGLMAALFVPGLFGQSGNDVERVLIRASKPYAPLVSKIESLGGKVTQQYQHIDAIAAEVPLSVLEAVRNAAGASSVGKDDVIPAPAPVNTARGRQGLASSGAEDQIFADGVTAIGSAELPSLAAAFPDAYVVYNSIMNLGALHAGGYTGAGVTVALIDSGIRPGFPHISLDGSVVGCEDFVGDALGCSNFANSGHGTFVAGMISANVAFTFSTTSGLRNAVLAECPACVVNPPANTVIPMVGSAPLSSIYALRVFGATGGSPTSRIIAAMDRAIELRRKFNAGEPGGVNIRVCNMSLGGSGIAVGRDLYNSAVEIMLRNDIVTVIAAGNAGPSSLTVGNPGAAVASLTVGAASLPHNERILRRLQFGSATGSLFRPFLGVQTSYFSSRGPNADGRNDPDVTANGFANYGQGFSSSTSGITIGSGTSFASPSVAGVAAVLRQRFPKATAAQVRNAIIMSGNPSLLADGSTSLDQGNGFVDAAAAAALLASGAAPDVVPRQGFTTKSVETNIEQNTFLDVRDGVVAVHFSNLKPGQRYEVPYRVAPNTSQVIVNLSGVTPALPPSQQNQLFGDDVLLTIHSAKTSSIGEGDYPVFEFTTGGTFAADNPEVGVMRVTVNGDWTNAGTISGDITIFSTTQPVPQITTHGKIGHGQTVVLPINVPSGVTTAEFQLGWDQNWGGYPTNDIDMILITPSGGLNFDGAALNNPEKAVITNPAAGTWLVLVDGFEIPTLGDRFSLRVSLDGNVVQ